MNRKQVKKLQQVLLNRRDALRKSLAGELREFQTAAATVGDSADAAVDADHAEINSQLAQVESRELARIENALERLRNNTYGTCEVCSGKIAAMRLQALPYATMCIQCQLDLERNETGNRVRGDWAGITDADEGPAALEQVSLRDFDLVA
jgi:DnaK suppressor protein